MSNLNDSIKKLYAIGDARAKLYSKLNISSINDLITYYPRGYINLLDNIEIASCEIGETYAIKARIYKLQGEQRIRKGLSIFKAFATDDTANIVITIFNARFAFQKLQEDKEYIFYGKVSGNLLKKEMNSPLIISSNEENLIRPIYPLTQGLTNNMLSASISQAIKYSGDCLTDSLPQNIREENKLCRFRYALENIHFPKDMYALKLAKERLIFDELLTLMLGMSTLKTKDSIKNYNILKDTNVDEFYNLLPFEFTNGQKNATIDILKDMSSTRVMNRLLQGDVGCGKTMVAAVACYACAKNGFQSAVMAPTQILAKQHYETLYPILNKLGIEVVLITGGVSKKKKEDLSRIRNGEAKVVIGTHALLSENVNFKKLSLVVTDEQHRFGVEQRNILTNKGNNPHLLVMSATPIPRTLALIIYGDLEVSLIKELPKGRQKINTHVITSQKRTRALSFIKKELDDGHQAYIVCPAIEETENELLSVTEYINALRKTPLASYNLQILTGKMTAKEKESIMQKFNDKEIEILISTTVIEVGIDVKNATTILIENSERFGLSQLHQLRGRVGRGEFESHCILVSDNMSEQNKKRLSIMKNSTDGFYIAEEDLKLRGPGNFFGYKQHGLPDLKIASLLDNSEILGKVKAVAENIIETDPLLEKPENRGLKNSVAELFSSISNGNLN